MFKGRFSNSTGVVGLDLGERYWRLLQLRRQTDGLRVVGAAMVDAPPEDADEITWEAFADTLRAAVGRGGFTGRRCVIAFPRGSVRVQSIRLPRMPASEMKQACQWEAASRFNLDRENLLVDYIATGAQIPNQDKQEEVILIATPRPEVMPGLKAILESGLRPFAAETKFTALARFFSRRARRESDRGRVRAIVEIGRRGGVVMVLRGDQVAFCRTLEISGENLDQAVADHLEMDLPAAADLRASHLARQGDRENENESSLAGEYDTRRVVFEAVRPLLYALVKEVKVCLRYYGVTFRGQPPEAIILAGTEGGEPHLAELLTRTGKIPVSIDDEQETLKVLGPELSALLPQCLGSVSGWAAAAGLSVRGMNERTGGDAAKNQMNDSAEDQPARTRKSDIPRTFPVAGAAS